MSKAFASIKRGLQQAIRHQKGKRAGGFEPGAKDDLVEFVRKSPLAGAALDIRRSRGVGARHLRENRIALLKILALGRREVEEGRTVPAAVAFRRLRERRSRR